jgi:hypothetical protein
MDDASAALAPRYARTIACLVGGDLAAVHVPVLAVQCGVRKRESRAVFGL